MDQSLKEDELDLKEIKVLNFYTSFDQFCNQKRERKNT